MFGKQIALLRKDYWGAGSLVVLAFFTHSWGFISDIPNYIIWALLLYIIAKSVGGRTSKLALFFLALLPWGILAFDTDPCFRSWLRYGNFGLLFLAMGPVFNSRYAMQTKIKALNMLLICSIITGVGSFFCFFLGINYMRMMNAQMMMYKSGGYFGGLCIHSMTLGPLSAIGVISAMYLYLLHRKKIYLIMLVLCMGAVLFSASRAALIATVAGILAVTYYISSHRSIMVRRLFILGILALFTFPLWKGATTLMVSKHEKNVERGSMTMSRDEKFIYRIAEFKESPLFGVGFCAIDPKTGDDYSPETGTIEPGSAWLQVPSMTGLAGTIPFILLLLVTWHNTSSQLHKFQRGLLMGLLVLFLLHFCAEGYLFSAGGELCCFAWLVIACCFMPWQSMINNEGCLFALDADLISRK